LLVAELENLVFSFSLTVVEELVGTEPEQLF
jgi:hypothetical protein